MQDFLINIILGLEIKFSSANNNRKILSCERIFHLASCIYKPNSVALTEVRVIAIYLGLALLRDSSDSSFDCSRDTILHRGKDLAVSL